MVVVYLLLYLPVAIGLGVLAAPVAAAGTALACLYAYLATQGRVMASRSSPAPLRYAPPEGPTRHDQEPAWRQYFFGQALVDLGFVLDQTSGRCSAQLTRLARRINRLGFRDDEGAPWTAPFALAAWLALLVGTAVGAAVVGALALVHAVVVLTVQLAALALVLLLRLADSALLQLKHISITCTTCHRRVPYPAYACPGAPGCRRLHRDVRPGPYGVFRRVCACGTRLPTLLLLGSYRLDAHCPWDEVPLVDRAGTARELVLPVFGPTYAGKTRLMLTAVLALDELAGRTDMSVESADDDTRRRFETLKPGLVRGEPTGPTPPAVLPKGYSLRVVPPRGAERVVHVFDAAGEVFASRERTQELRYLRIARTFLFVVDPLSVESFWRSLAEHERRGLDAARRPTQPPDFVFHQTANHLERIGVKTDRARLAVAISKTDLVGTLSTLQCVQGSSRSVERWLDRELGMGNMVRWMRLRFGEVRFFLTAAVLNDGAVDASVTTLLRWVAEGEQLRLPEAPDGQ